MNIVQCHTMGYSTPEVLQMNRNETVSSRCARHCGQGLGTRLIQEWISACSYLRVAVSVTLSTFNLVCVVLDSNRQQSTIHYNNYTGLKTKMLKMNSACRMTSYMQHIVT